MEMKQEGGVSPSLYVAQEKKREKERENGQYTVGEKERNTSRAKLGKMTRHQWEGVHMFLRGGS